MANPCFFGTVPAHPARTQGGHMTQQAQGDPTPAPDSVTGDVVDGAADQVAAAASSDDSAVVDSEADENQKAAGE